MKKETKVLSPKSLENLQTFNWADFRLYQYFVQKQRREISEIGEDKVNYYKDMIIKKSEELHSECLKKVLNPIVPIPIAYRL